jgi:hypothetical protein
MKMRTPNTKPAHFAPELLKVENTHKAKTIQIARIISCMKLTENPITEKATPEKNHFLICCGNITFMRHYQ